MQRLLIFGLTFCLVGCNRDLEVPPLPDRVPLIGTVNLGGHIPLADNDVTLIRSENGDRFVQQTDATGAFRFPDLSPGTYVIKLALPGFAPLNEGPYALRGEELDVGVLTPVWLAQTPSEAVLTGRVVVASGNNGSGDAGVINDGGVTDAGIQDAGIRPADSFGATVRFLLQNAGNTPVDEVTVNAFGGFSTRLPPGLYTLEATHPYYVTDTRRDVMLGEAQRLDLSSQPLVLQLNPAEVRGQIFREVDNDATPLVAAGARVTSDTGLAVVTDANGRFALGGLAAGTRTLTITLAEYHDAQPTRTVQLGAGENAVLPPLTLLIDRGDLTGEVSMGDGSPLQLVSAEIPGTTYNANVIQLSASPERGRYTIHDVPVGNYNVRASRQNYIPTLSATVRVRADQPVAVDLLTLARSTGDFVVDDADPTSTVGFTRVRDVTLQVTNALNTAAYRTAEGTAGNLLTATWVPFSSTTLPFQVSPGDGPKPIYLQLRDTMMAVGPPLSSTIVLDQTPPTSVTFQLGGGSEFSRVANPIAATLSGLDPGSGIAFFRMQEGPSDGGQLTIGRQPYLRDTSFSRSSNSDGLAVVVAELIDNAGNISVVVQDQIVIDTFAPIGSVTITRGLEASRDGYTNEPLVVLAETVSMAEPLGGYVQVKLANDLADLSTAVLQPFKASAVWPLEPTEGLKTVHYVFVDAAGNEGAAGTATIRLDRTAPVIAATLTSPNPTRSLALALSFTLTEANLLSPTRGLTLSESAFFTGAIATAYPGNDQAAFNLPAGDGNRELFVRVRDAAGNEGSTSVQVLLDQTPPTNGTLTLTGTLGDLTSSTTLTSTSAVTVSTTVTGATGILLGSSGLGVCPSTSTSYAAWNGADLPGHSLPGGGGSRQVNACFIDAADNVRGPLTATIEFDAAQPVGCAVRLTGLRKDGSTTLLRKTADRTVPVTLTGCSEVPLEIFFTEAPTIVCNAMTSVNWRPWSATNSETLQLSTGDNLKSVQGCVRDRFRNVGSLAVDTLTLDTTAPTGPTVSIDLGATWVNRAQFLTRLGFKANVGGSASGATQWAIAESATPSSFSDITVGNPVINFLFSSGDGVKTIQALFSDDVGNITPVEASDSIEFDTTNPTLTGLTLAGTTADGNGSTLISSTLSVSASLVQTGASGIFKADTIVTCPTSGYESFSGSSLALTLGGPGPSHSLAVCVSDAAGNVAGPLTDSIDVDLTLPTGCVLVLIGRNVDGSNTGGTTANKTARIDLTANLNTCTETPQEIAFSESAITCSATASLDWRSLGTGTVALNLSSGDGPKTMFGCVRDRARNVSSFVSDAITLDTVPPTAATLLIEGGVPYVNLARSVVTGGYRANVTGTALDATHWALAEGSTPSAFVTFSSPATLLQPFSAGDGLKTMRALFRDDVGNITALESSDSIDFDLTPPTFTSVLLSGTLADGSPSTAVTSTASVSAALSQTGATRAFTADGPLGACPATGYSLFSGSALAVPLGGSATTRTLSVCLSDEAGNLASTTPRSDDIDVDTTTPTSCALAITGKRVDGSNTSGATVDKTARIDINAALPSCSEAPIEVVLTESVVICSATATLDWRSVGTGTVPFTLSSGDGSKRVYGCVRDRARNVGSATFDDITLDTAPPTNASVTLDTGNPYVNRAQWTALGGVNNIASARGIATEAAEWARAETSAPTAFIAFTTPTDLNFTFSLLDGEKTIRVLFRDDVGNVTPTESTDSITFDTQLPSFSRITLAGSLADGTPDETVTSTTATSATLVQTDGVSLFQTTTAITACPAGVYPPYSGGTVAVTLGPSGSTRSVWMCLKDVAGNPIGPVTDDILFDNTASTNCTLVITGYSSDRRTATAGSVAAITGSTDVDLTLTGCDENPVEVALAESSLPCTNTATLTWQSYTPGMRFSLSLGDELKTVQGCLRDSTLNVGTFISDGVTLDTTPPAGVTLTLASGAPYTTAVMVNAAVTGTDAVSNTNARLSMQLSLASDFSGAPVLPFTPSSAFDLVAQGVLTVHVRVLDEMGNASVDEDIIEFDRTAPTLGGTPVTINAGAPATNSSTVTLALSATDASRMKVHAYQQPSVAGACSSSPTVADADFDAETEVPYVSSLTYVLPPGETSLTECKFVGVRFADAAGNYTSIADSQLAKILLDTIAPDAPQIDTPGQVANLATIDVLLSTNAVDPHLLKYQALYAGAPGWTDVATSGATNPLHLTSCLSGTPPPLCNIRVTLLANTGATTPNRENLISLRGVDIAGNASATASITIVRDHADPNPPPNFLGVPGDGRVSLTWNASNSPDLAGYQVRYMLSPGGTCSSVPADYGGSFADQGVSPINVGLNRSMLLTGVPNGVALCVAVQAYDGTQTPGKRESSLSVMGVTPFEVAPALRARLTNTYLGLGAGDKVGALAVRNGLLYAATTMGLKELDVSNEGCFDLTSAALFQSCVGLVTSFQPLADPRDMVLHGRYAYVADGAGGLKVFELTEGAPPIYIRNVVLPSVTMVRGVAASGNFLAVAHPTGYALMTLATMSDPTVQKVETLMPSTFDVDLQGAWMMIARSTASANMFFDISAPAAPLQTATARCDLSSPPYATRISGAYAYFLTFSDTLEICALAAGPVPRPVTSVSPVEARARIEIHGSYLFSTGVAANNELGGYSQFLDVTDISDKAAARFLGRYYSPPITVSSTEHGSIAAEGNRVFMASGLSPTIEVVHVGEPRSFDLIASGATVLGSNDTRGIKDQLVVPYLTAQVPEALASFKRLGVLNLDEDFTFRSTATVVTDTDYVTYLDTSSFRIGVLANQPVGAGVLDSVVSHTAPTPAGGTQWKVEVGATQWPHLVTPALSRNTTTNNWTVQLQSIDLRPVGNPYTVISSATLATTIPNINGGVFDNPFNTIQNVGLYGGNAYVAIATAGSEMSTIQNASEGIWRVPIDVNGGLTAGTQVYNTAPVVGVAPYGRFLYYWTRSGYFYAQPLASGTWAPILLGGQETVTKVTNEGNSSNGRFEFTGNFLFVPRRATGFRVFKVNHTFNTTTSRYEPSNLQQVISYDVGSFATSILVRGDTVTVNNQSRAFDIFRMR